MDSEEDDRLEIDHQYRRNAEDDDDLDAHQKSDRSSNQSDSCNSLITQQMNHLRAI